MQGNTVVCSSCCKNSVTYVHPCRRITNQVPDDMDPQDQYNTVMLTAADASCFKRVISGISYDKTIYMHYGPSSSIITECAACQITVHNVQHTRQHSNK